MDPYSRMMVFHRQGENIFPRSITLKGEWECALVECAFRKSWPIIPVDQQIKLLHYHENSTREIINSKAVLPKGDYETSVLVDKVNKLIDEFFEEKDGHLVVKGLTSKKVTDKPLFTIDTYINSNTYGYVFQRPGIINGADLFYVTFDNYLGEVLGFPAETLYQRVDNRLKALNGAEDRTINILNEVFGLTRPKKNPIELIYVTSNITDYRLLINNKFVNLLNIIKIPSNAERNELLHYNFDKAIYLPITENPMQRISLILNDLIGDKLC